MGQMFRYMKEEHPYTAFFLFYLKLFIFSLYKETYDLQK